MIMFTMERQPILDIAALKCVMRQKLNFQDSAFISPLIDPPFPDFMLEKNIRQSDSLSLNIPFPLFDGGEAIEKSS